MPERLIRIASRDLSAAINLLGAELTSLRDAGGRELMTDADPAYWGGHAPILFPIVGRLNGDVLRVDGREYPMKQHGFARRSTFAVVECAADRAVFRLTDSDETRRAYPFAFRLDVAFSLAGATLAIEATIANPADAPLPASFGFHPAFAWPLPYGAPREDHRIFLNGQEGATISRLTSEGTIAAEPIPSPLEERCRLRLRDDLFEQDALIWIGVDSDQLVYGGNDGPQLMIGFADTPDLGVWSQPGAHFVCVEPWHGHADPVGFTGEFRDKPGVFEVAPGEERRIGMSVALVG